MHFVFDANLPHRLAEGLNVLESGNRRTDNPAIVGHVFDFLPNNATDEEIILQAKVAQWIIITQDLGFGRIEHQFELLKLHGISVIFFRPLRKGFSYWEYVKTFVNKWEDLKAEVGRRKGLVALVVEKSGAFTHLKVH